MAVGIVLGPILGFLVAAVVTRVTPIQYESTAVVQVMSPSSGHASAGVLGSRQFFATQFEVITASKTLAPVVEELDLVRQWGKNQDEIIGTLKESITVSQVTGTDLISITVRFVDPVLGQKIAEGVANSYQNRRNNEERQRADIQLEALDAEIQEQKAHVEKTRKALDAFVRITGRTYFEGNGSESTPDVEASEDAADREALRREGADYRRLTADYEAALSLLQELKLAHSTRRVELRAPRVAVTIHEQPKVGLRPVSPNVPLNLAIGIVGGEAVGIAGRCFVHSLF